MQYFHWTSKVHRWSCLTSTKKRSLPSCWVLQFCLWYSFM